MSAKRSVKAKRSKSDLPEIPNITDWGMGTPRHSGTAFRVRHRLRTTVVCVVVAMLAFVGTAAAATYVNIDGIIKGQGVNVITQNGRTDTVSIVDPNAGKPLDVLILGQDTRSGDNLELDGGGSEFASNHNSDTAMILHISADRKFADLVSIPRDSIVDVPSCQTTKGTIKAQYNVMFNTIFAGAYSSGGDLASAASCALNAVNSLTGLDIQNFIVVDFAGLKSMIDAIGGVDICIPTHVSDGYTGLDIDAGWQHLDGTVATQYARRRHGADTDGTDMERTARQQYLVKQLIAQALAKNLLTQSSQLYQLAKAALKSLNLSTGLANTTTLAGLAMSMKDFKTENLYTRTVPVTDWVRDKNRVVWTSEADTLWSKIRNDQPFVEQTDTSSSDQNSDSSSTDEQSQTTDQSQQQDTTPAPTNTTVAEGVEKTPQGSYVDTATGGTIDEKTGIIRNPTTNVVMGISDSYLNNVVCKVK